MIVEGTLRSLVLFDIADAIRIHEVEAMLGSSSGEPVRAFPRAAPEYVRFEHPPVIELYPGGRINYYDYGVISVEADLPFSGTWGDLVERSSRWVANPAAEKAAVDLLKPRLDRYQTALSKPYAHWLTEDYYVVLLNLLPCSAKQLLDEHGMQVAQIIRGETAMLSDDERDDVLKSRISYFPNDLVVIGWSTALVCDSPAGSAPTMQLLDYANTQLLEYRHYDELLSGLLEQVHKQLDEGTGFLARWRMARRAARLNTIRLDVIELAERTDNSIKFLSDMFYARLYQLAAAQVGVPDYRDLVDEKLRTAGELYEFMVDQFQQGRAFVLELMVVIILVVELGLIFRGK